MLDEQENRIATTHVEEDGRYYSQKARFGFEVGSGQILATISEDDESNDSKDGK